MFGNELEKIYVYSEYFKHISARCTIIGTGSGRHTQGVFGSGRHKYKLH